MSSTKNRFDELKTTARMLEYPIAEDSVTWETSVYLFETQRHDRVTLQQGNPIRISEKIEMARLGIDSDDELPEISTLLQLPVWPGCKAGDQSTAKGDEKRKSPRKRIPQSRTEHDQAETFRVLGSKASIDEQRPLRPLQSIDINHLSPPNDGEGKENKTISLITKIDVRSSPRRKAQMRVDYSIFAPRLSDGNSSTSESEDSLTDLSGFIVPDSASDDDAFQSRACKGRDRKVGKGEPVEELSRETSIELGVSRLDQPDKTEQVNVTSPKKVSRRICPESPPRVQSPDLYGPAAACSGFDEPFSRIRFSPPRFKLPYKSKDGSRPVTPPLSPPNSKLQSPSKRNRVPPSPHRPSIDAFWSADVINDWNDQHSPKKVLKSPRKNGHLPIYQNQDELSPSESPRQNPNKSPSKRNKKAAERKKIFDLKKHDLAISFLAEVDETIGDRQVSALADPTGGIRILWSKKLSSTAGRANWRKETVRTKNADGTVSSTTHRHHASIELAEKVIDDEDRLRNVLAHEYCHLANFMLSGVKDNPHGASFKRWATSTTAAFADRGVKVTTKHMYEIDYRYVWVCVGEECGTEYKRHSKSIDVEKHSCGSCKGKLVQVKPVPRRGNEKGEGKKGGAFQAFVKVEWERVRRENEGLRFGEIMAVLGREFRESKARDAARNNGNGPEKDGENVGEKPIDYGDLDSVARKLDFLSLKT